MSRCTCRACAEADTALARRPAQVRTGPALGHPGDRYEDEAERIADRVTAGRPVPLTGPLPAPPPPPLPVTPLVQRQAEENEDEGERETVQAKPAGTAACRGPRGGAARAARAVAGGGGRPLPDALRGWFEPRFGHDLGHVRLHTAPEAAEAARGIAARAYTLGPNIAFAPGHYAPATAAGRRLLAHEITHTLQQGARERVAARPAVVQRDGPAAAPPQADPAPAPALDRPLSEWDWSMVRSWQAYGEVGIEPLTDNAQQNALIIASAIFCQRMLAHLDDPEDPLLCIDDALTRADPRVVSLAGHVAARGPIVNWTRATPDQRALRAMELLVDTYHVPENGAAGLVGNLMAESGVVPTKIEHAGARLTSSAPLADRTAAGQERVFTPEEVRDRGQAGVTGPSKPGIGLAQWTSGNRRSGLFQHSYQGRQMGVDILFSMEGQMDYLVSELQASYAGVYATITAPGVSLNDASDEVVYLYERPRSVTHVVNGHRTLRPRTDPQVQGIFAARRRRSARALRAYRAAHPAGQQAGAAAGHQGGAAAGPQGGPH